MALALILGGCAHRTPAEVRAQEVLSQAKVAEVDLRIDCTPLDAEVSVDRVPRGLCSDYQDAGTGLRLGKGMHQVAVRKAGFHPYVTYVEPSGARLSLTARLVPEKAEGSTP